MYFCDYWMCEWDPRLEQGSESHCINSHWKSIVFMTVGTNIGLPSLISKLNTV